MLIPPLSRLTPHISQTPVNHLADCRAGRWAGWFTEPPRVNNHVALPVNVHAPTAVPTHSQTKKIQNYSSSGFWVIQGHPFPCKWDANNGLRIRI